MGRQAGRARGRTDKAQSDAASAALPLSLYLGGKEDGSNAMRREARAGGGDDGGTADEAIQKREGLSICRKPFALLCYLAVGTYVVVTHACSMYSR